MNCLSVCLGSAWPQSPRHNHIIGWCHGNWHLRWGMCMCSRVRGAVKSKPRLRRKKPWSPYRTGVWFRVWWTRSVFLTIQTLNKERVNLVVQQHWFFLLHILMIRFTCLKDSFSNIIILSLYLLRFQSSKSGKIYLHRDVRLLFSRKSMEVDSGAAYELKSYTESPTNPQFSPRCWWGWGAI